MMDRIERIKQSFDIRKISGNDTHDYIQRRDPDHFKHQDKSQEDWSDHDEDLTDISVESLIIFLEGLKKDQVPRTPKIDPEKPIDTTMQQAIQAYNHNDPAPQKRYTYLDEGEQDIDFMLVDQLITDLKAMLEDDIVHITLLPADGFLESIKITVEKIHGV